MRASRLVLALWELRFPFFCSSIERDLTLPVCMQIGDTKSNQQGMHAVALAHDRPAGKTFKYQNGNSTKQNSAANDCAPLKDS